MISEFFFQIAELKKLPRSGWKIKVGLENSESVAEHSYMMSVMSMVLSDMKSLDSEKVLKMAILHDWAESKIGDFMPEQIGYDKESELPCKEIDPIHPTDYRGRLIKEYEEKQIDFYSDKLIILRFSGLYDSHSKKISKNHLHRDNAAEIIKFFIEKDFDFKSYEIFNCSEDNPNGKISNKKIKDLEFNFREYN